MPKVFYHFIIMIKWMRGAVCMHAMIWDSNQSQADVICLCIFERPVKAQCFVWLSNY